MLFNVRHSTRFRYSQPVRESIMEVRMHPRTEGKQRCLSFSLAVSPRARVSSFVDHVGNNVEQFDIATQHRTLSIVADAVVDVQAPDPLPDALPASAWQSLDDDVATQDFWEFLEPSEFVHDSQLLAALRASLGVRRGADPLTLLRRLNTQLFEWFDYAPSSTRVDSSIDDALAQRKGVCQDFTHVMLALLRPLGVPARYVSGYVMQRDGGYRSLRGASHAWVEAYLPGLGWIGLDPTNNLLPGEKHVRTAVGRDYADVPPTRGVFKGTAESELKVVVVVTPYNAPLLPDEVEAEAEWEKARAAAVAPGGDDEDEDGQLEAQQQQQQ